MEADKLSQDCGLQIFKTELRSYVCQVLFTKAHGFAGAALR